MNFIEKLFNTFKDYFAFISGVGGSILIDGSYSDNDTFKVITFASDSTVTYSDKKSGKTISNLSVPAGFQIFGDLFNVTVTGTAIGYIK